MAQRIAIRDPLAFAAPDAAAECATRLSNQSRRRSVQRLVRSKSLYLRLQFYLLQKPWRDR